MVINEISKEKKEVVVSFDTAELIKLCNVLCCTEERFKDGLYHKLYSDLILARDLSQYGGIDNFTLANIADHRGADKIEKQLKELKESREKGE